MKEEYVMQVYEDGKLKYSFPFEIKKSKKRNKAESKIRDFVYRENNCSDIIVQGKKYFPIDEIIRLIALYTEKTK